MTGTRRRPAPRRRHLVPRLLHSCIPSPPQPLGCGPLLQEVPRHAISTGHNRSCGCHSRELTTSRGNWRFEVPTALGRRTAIGSNSGAPFMMQRVLKFAEVWFEPIPEPRPTDWLGIHPELMQTFDAFKSAFSENRHKMGPSPERQCMHILPLGPGDPDQTLFSHLRGICAAFFSPLRVALLRTPDDVPKPGPRGEIDADQVLAWMSSGLRQNSAVTIALTEAPLVSGGASTIGASDWAARVCVCSINKYVPSPPAESDAIPDALLPILATDGSMSMVSCASEEADSFYPWDVRARASSSATGSTTANDRATPDSMGAWDTIDSIRPRSRARTLDGTELYKRPGSRSSAPSRSTMCGDLTGDTSSYPSSPSPFHDQYEGTDSAFATDRRQAQDDLPVIFERITKLILHETVHMFGVLHCCYYRCLMNGSSTVEEVDAKPPYLCGMCLKKLHHVTGFEPLERYVKLAHAWHAAAREDISRWYSMRVAIVQSTLAACRGHPPGALAWQRSPQSRPGTSLSTTGPQLHTAQRAASRPATSQGFCRRDAEDAASSRESSPEPDDVPGTRLVGSSKLTQQAKAHRAMSLFRPYESDIVDGVLQTVGPESLFPLPLPLQRLKKRSPKENMQVERAKAAEEAIETKTVPVGRRHTRKTFVMDIGRRSILDEDIQPDAMQSHLTDADAVPCA